MKVRCHLSRIFKMWHWPLSRGEQKDEKKSGGRKMEKGLLETKERVTCVI